MVGCMAMAAAMAAAAAAAVTFITSPVAKPLVLLRKRRPTNTRARAGRRMRTKAAL